MKLSNNADRYFSKLKRNEEFVINADDLIKYFEVHNIPKFEKIIEFQLKFSGIELKIENDESSNFNAFLVSKTDIKNNNEIEYLIIENTYYFFCGDHQTAQFWFVISDKGEICTYNNNNETVNILYTSFEKFIENYAFIDLVKQNKKYEHPGYYNLLDFTRFDELVKSFTIYDSSNDKFNKWISNGSLVINKGLWLHEHSFYIHIYGKNKEECDIFLKLLKIEKIID
ncbi:hypothetical protein ASE40_03580 [Flavobacterium sp. Root935]|jgi:hypothetical protein|uniref:hypothetical protein n=1 Tax=unclassified Flavobacterium TaxID=196869 RepID=UPI00070AA8CE|nr:MULTISPECIES: hypothetical protein [unclassified Flavobacterium]KRD62882.1 hypothetical protein ASE40_03580 [Flavobacterium sp. Root935]TDX13501.1 hypothetical protein EDB96_0196 [Flavobacterium sp. S87F.05.LMB.W.Kidney.N]